MTNKKRNEKVNGHFLLDSEFEKWEKLLKNTPKKKIKKSRDSNYFGSGSFLGSAFSGNISVGSVLVNPISHNKRFRVSGGDTTDDEDEEYDDE